MPAPSVVAIILNYNGADLTLETIESMKEVDYPNLTILVVDNGSTDDSFDRIAAAHPDLEQLSQTPNRGIPPGINRGLCRGRELGADYLLALNNDIQVDAAMVRHMVELAESDSRIGCVGPKTCYFDDKKRLWSTGGKISFREAITRERGQGEIDRGQYDRDEEMGYINGCAILIRRAALEATGLLNPTFFLGVEDADWCQRAKAQGFSCFYSHKAVLWHKVSQSLGIYNPFRTFYTGRSTAAFVRLHAGATGWLSFLAMYGASLPFAYLRERRHGNQKAVWEKLRGVSEGLRMPLSQAPPLPPLVTDE